MITDLQTLSGSKIKLPNIAKLIYLNLELIILSKNDKKTGPRLKFWKKIGFFGHF